MRKQRLSLAVVTFDILIVLGEIKANIFPPISSTTSTTAGLSWLVLQSEQNYIEQKRVSTEGNSYVDFRTSLPPNSLFVFAALYLLWY